MKEKGFAITGILYVLLIIFLASMTMLLFNLQNRKMILDQLKLDVVEAVESDNNYEYLLNKISELEARIGNEDISSLGTGTITSALNSINFDDIIHPLSASSSFTSSTGLTYTGLSVTVPAKAYFCVTAMAFSDSSPARVVSINRNSTAGSSSLSKSSDSASNLALSTTVCSVTGNTEVTYYLWASYSSASTNSGFFRGFYINYDSIN